MRIRSEEKQYRRRSSQEIKRPITAERLRDLRKEAGLSQEKLAEELRGISSGSISAALIKQMELGSRSLSEANLKAYVKYFKCSESYITGRSPYRDRIDAYRAMLSPEERARDKYSPQIWRLIESWIQEETDGAEIDDEMGFKTYCDIMELIREKIEALKNS